MSRRVREGLKSLLLVGLLLSAGVLCWLSWFSGMENTAREQSAALPQVAAVQPAAQPVSAGVFWLEGAYGAVYQSSGVGLIQDLWGDLLGQCLSAAESLEEKTVRDWCAALEGSGVYFAYEAEIPVTALTLWQGYAPGPALESFSARRVFLAAGEEGFRLWLRGEAGVWCCETAFGHSELGRLGTELLDNGAELSVAAGEEQLLLPGEVVRPRLETLAFLPGEENLTVLVKPFHLSAYAGNRYTGQDGALVFVEGSRTLRLEADGWGIYQDRSSQENDGQLLLPLGADATSAEIIEAARGLAETVIGSLSGDGVLGLSSFRQGEETVVCFQLLVDGVPLRLGQPAFELHLRGEVVTQAVFCLNGARKLESTLRAMPALQAAAAASGSITLGYLPGEGGWTLGWMEE